MVTLLGRATVMGDSLYLMLVLIKINDNNDNNKNNTFIAYFVESLIWGMQDYAL